MKINIINLDKDRWILTKIAKKLCINLKLQGHTVNLTKKAMKNADINHYIIFLFQKEKEKYYFKNTVNTTMLTHINDDFRFSKVRNISKFMDAGIAFSKDHANFIDSKKLGLKKVFSVLPSHDGDLKLKKLHFGIFTNLYNDGRKEERVFVETVEMLNPKFVKFSIIGKGWKKYVLELRRKGFEIDYQRYFFRTRYVSELKKIDYLIYLGSDEGSMSFLDSIQMGIKTIMIPQGFQKDLRSFITHELRHDLGNFGTLMKKLVNEKKKFLDLREEISWKNYASKHIEIWQDLLKKKKQSKNRND